MFQKNKSWKEYTENRSKVQNKNSSTDWCKTKIQAPTGAKQKFKHRRAKHRNSPHPSSWAERLKEGMLYATLFLWK